MHTNYVLEEVSVPQSPSPPLSFSLPLCVFVSHSTLPVFGFAGSCRIALNIALTFFQGITKRERLKITLIVAAWPGQKARGGYLFIYFIAY